MGDIASVMRTSKYESSRPQPTSDAERARIVHTSLRRRILYGLWEEDEKQYIRRRVGEKRQRVWRTPDLSTCLLRAFAEVMNVTYATLPSLAVEGQAPSEPEELHFVKAMRRHFLGAGQLQRDWLAMRATLAAVEPDDELGFRTRQVFADDVWDLVLEGDTVVALKERRTYEGDGGGWVVEEFDSRTLHYRATVGSKDVTAEMLEGQAGYPWVSVIDGRAYVPYAIWRASLVSEDPWDAWTWVEIVCATLHLAMLSTFASHGVFSASWIQKVLINGLPVGLRDTAVGDGQPVQSVESDPATVMVVEGLREGQETPPQATSFAASVDPDKLEVSILSWLRRVMSLSGLNASDAVRVSGDPRSGYALEVSAEARREMQRTLSPIAEVGDTQLLKVAARVFNQSTVSDMALIDEDSWSITYGQIPLSRSEQKANADLAQNLRDQRLVDQVGAAAIVYGVDRNEARRRLEEMNLLETEPGQTDPSRVVPGETAPGTPAGAGGEKAQDTALNGAQVQAAQAVVESVADGRLPRGTGIQMLATFFRIPVDTAELLMGDVGTDKFTPAPPAEPARAAEA